jgi:hypothetical protein
MPVERRAGPKAPIEVGPSPAVWPSEFPEIEYLFDLIEGQPFLPDGTFHVGIPVELVSRALVE